MLMMNIKKKCFQFVERNKYAVVAEVQKMLVTLPYRLSMASYWIPSPSHLL